MTAFTREDFEHAAKAAGIEYDADHAKRRGGKVAMFGLWLKIKGEPYEGQRRHWNPITDDGDALRLAVKLHISFWRAGECSVAGHGAIGPKMGEPHNGGDPYAATRRAIFRAAIAIGKAMP